MSSFDITQGIARGSLGHAMTGGQMADAMVCGTPVMTRIVRTPTVKLSFPQWGDLGYRLLFHNPCSLSFAGAVKGQLQRMTLILQQPYEGNGGVDFVDEINWQGKQPFMDTRAGSVTMIEIVYDGLNTYYGRLIYG